MARIWMADYPPASADDKDDEFDDSSLSGSWTELDNDNNMTPSEGAYGLSLLQATRTSTSISGVFRAAQSGDFAIWTHLSVLGKTVGAGYPSFGLMLGQDLTNNPTTSDIVTFGLQLRNGVSHYLFAALYTKFDTYSALYGTALDDGAITTGIYLRIRQATTTLLFDWSTNGISWIQFASNARPFTPAEFGIYVDNYKSGVDMRIAGKFFRCVDGTPALTDVMQGKRVM